MLAFVAAAFVTAFFALALLLREVWNAPHGYEDDRGFHYAAPMNELNACPNCGHVPTSPRDREQGPRGLCRCGGALHWSASPEACGCRPAKCEECAAPYLSPCFPCEYAGQ